MDNELVMETVKELLPEIEQEIRSQVNQELQMEYAELFRQDIEKWSDIDTDTIRKELESELRANYAQQRDELAEQIIREFDEQLTGQQSLEQKLRERIQGELDEQVQLGLQKKSKEIKMQYKQKLEREKQNLRKGFEMEWKQKVEMQRKYLDKEKSEIARLKSLQYVKLKKLAEEKKEHQKQLTEQELKYREIVNSLQKQTQELAQQLEYMLQKQIQQDQQQSCKSQQQLINKFQFDTFNKNDLPLQIKPLYEHKVTEIDQSTILNDSIQHPQIITNVQCPPIKCKQQPVSLYQQELQKPKQKQEYKQKSVQSAQNKENTMRQNKIDVIIQNTYKEEKPDRNTVYDNLFMDNDLDNSKNKQMKQQRQQLLQQIDKDLKWQTKYQAAQINFVHEYIDTYQNTSEYDEVKYLLQELIGYWTQWRVSFNERIELLSQFKQLSSPTSLKAILPLIQKQVYNYKIINNKLQIFKDRTQIQQQIVGTFKSYAQCKEQFEKLLELDQQLDGVNINVRGCQLSDLLKIDRWEKDYLEREELKNQLLQKIQQKLL